jgi:hypothetical protein
MRHMDEVNIGTILWHMRYDPMKVLEEDLRGSIV